jgi:hypothetical protein
MVRFAYCGGWQSLSDHHGSDNHNQADNDYNQNLNLLFLHNSSKSTAQLLFTLILFVGRSYFSVT